MTTVADALDYLALGWSVIPIHDRTKDPAVRSWMPFQTERPDAKKVRVWFRRSGERNIAVVLGPVSGDLICRDFDKLESYHTWAAEHRELADSLPTVATSKGRHVYCRADFDAIDHDDAIRQRKYVTLGDGELRLQGCYCLLPPSIHPDRTTYRWEKPIRLDLPVLDVHQAGLLPITRNREERRERKTTERTDAIECASPEPGNKNPGPARFGPAAGNSVASPIEIPSDIERAILETVPRGPGQRNKLVFELARTLKAVTSLADAPVTSLKPLVRQWHTLAKPFITTPAFEETWIDFVRGWSRVKFPKGTEPMAKSFADALDSDDPPEAAALGYDGEQVRLLARLCRELQRSAGTQPFYLSCGTVERLFKVNRGVAHRWLFLFVTDGLLELVEKGSQQSRRASRYFYRGRM